MKYRYLPVFGIYWEDRENREIYNAKEYFEMNEEQRAKLVPGVIEYAQVLLYAYCEKCKRWERIYDDLLSSNERHALAKAKSCEEFNMYMQLVLRHPQIMEKYFEGTLTPEELKGYMEKWIRKELRNNKYEAVEQTIDYFTTLLNYPFLEELRKEVKTKAISKSLKK